MKTALNRKMPTSPSGSAWSTPTSLLGASPGAWYPCVWGRLPELGFGRPDHHDRRHHVHDRRGTRVHDRLGDLALLQLLLVPHTELLAEFHPDWMVEWLKAPL